MSTKCTHPYTTTDITRDSTGRVVRCTETCNECRTVLRDAR
jgi:hypothetical protein